jgi:hypothetical protein
MTCVKWFQNLGSRREQGEIGSKSKLKLKGNGTILSASSFQLQASSFFFMKPFHVLASRPPLSWRPCAPPLRGRRRRRAAAMDFCADPAARIQGRWISAKPVLWGPDVRERMEREVL